MVYSVYADVTGHINVDFGAGTDPTSTEVAAFIADADAFIDKETGRGWGKTTVTNEYYDAVVHGDEPITIFVKNYPLITVTLVEWYDGSSWKTAKEGQPNDYPSDETYQVYKEQGMIKFYGLFIEGNNRLRVTYDWGYSSIPNYIKQLSSLLAALTVLAYLSGSEYANYRTGDLAYAYPIAGPYAEQWNRLSEKAKQLWRMVHRQPLADTG